MKSEAPTVKSAPLWIINDRLREISPLSPMVFTLNLLWGDPLPTNKMTKGHHHLYSKLVKAHKDHRAVR